MAQKYMLGRIQTWPYLPLLKRQPLSDMRKTAYHFFQNNLQQNTRFPAGSSNSHNPPLGAQGRPPIGPFQEAKHNILAQLKPGPAPACRLATPLSGPLGAGRLKLPGNFMLGTASTGVGT